MYTQQWIPSSLLNLFLSIVLYRNDLQCIMPEYSLARSSGPIFFHGMSQIDMIYVSNIILHLDFWFSLKMCKNVWNHIWRSKGTLFISQPPAWFMTTKLLLHPSFGNGPQQKWKRCSSKDLRTWKIGICGSNAWHGVCCQHLRCIMHFKF